VSVSGAVLNALCFDIDDLAYGLNVRNGTCLASRFSVEKETYALLEFLEGLHIKATMFVPGYVAGRFPGLVTDIRRGGHEVGAHGFSHVVAERLQRKGFSDDIRAGKKTLEDILSAEVSTYKAPEWGITPLTPWAYDELISAGYKIDNTARPSLLKFLGRSPEDMTPFRYKDSLTVIPVTSRKWLTRSAPFNGGFYCAYVPACIQGAYFRKLNQRGIPFNYYCHPFEVHPQGANRHAWRYGSASAAFYGFHFGIYRHHLSYLARHFKFGPLEAAYGHFIPHAATTAPQYSSGPLLPAAT
jgi:polysaccharide deacetylase family protein (PEP-CTERM system associated)